MPRIWLFDCTESHHDAYRGNTLKYSDAILCNTLKKHPQLK